MDPNQQPLNPVPTPGQQPPAAPQNNGYPTPPAPVGQPPAPLPPAPAPQAVYGQQPTASFQTPASPASQSPLNKFTGTFGGNGKRKRIVTAVLTLIVLAVGGWLAHGHLLESPRVRMANYIKDNNVTTLLENEGHALTALANAMSDKDATAWGTACNDLDTDTEALATLPAMPDKEANQSLQDLTADAKTIVQSCQDGLPTTAAQFEELSKESENLVKDATKLSERLDALADSK